MRTRSIILFFCICCFAYEVLAQCDRDPQFVEQQRFACQDGMSEFTRFQDDVEGANGAIASDINFKGFVYSTVIDGNPSFPLSPTDLRWSNSNLCADDNFTIYAYVHCSQFSAPEPFYHLAGVLNLTVHAPPAKPSLIRTNDNCDYELDFVCPGDIEGFSDVTLSTSPGYVGQNVNVQVITENGCSASFFLSKPACPSTCPEDPYIVLGRSAVCSNGRLSISGSFNVPAGGSLSGGFTITETTGTITGIVPGQAFVVPRNSGCDPITYTFVATATCSNGNAIPGQATNLTKTLTVYPEYNENLVQIVAGNCESAGAASSGCASYDLTPVGSPSIPDPGESGVDTWEVLHSGYPLIAPFEGDCMEQPTIVSVPYSCNPDCPAQPYLNTNQVAVCGNQSATINGFFSQGSDSGQDGNFTITESTGTITNIFPDQPFTLPPHNGCDPITYTFTGQATCEDGTPIPGNTSDMTVVITVFPQINPNFNSVTSGTCGVPAELVTACDNYILTVGTSTVPQPGDNASDIWTVDYNYDNFSVAPPVPCFSAVRSFLPYACNDNCPSDPSIEASLPAICSGRSGFISGSFGNAGTGGLSGNFSVTETTGTIAGITIGNPFSLPINTTCDPITYTFVATATCSDTDNTPIFGDNLTTTITVFPVFNADFIDVDAGICGIVGNATTSCNKYILIPPITSTIPEPGDNGIDQWIVDYIYTGFNDIPNNACFESENINVPYACNDNCPSDPSITASVNAVCSGGTARVVGAFGNTGTGGLGGSFSITEVSGTITGITDGVNFTLPTNNTCDPITYTFIATATCSDADNTPIFGPNLTTTITVFPALNTEFILIDEGVCGTSGTLSSTCNNYIITAPNNPTIPEPGSVGDDTWFVDYDYGNFADEPSSPCFNHEAYAVSYACNDNCPSEPYITTAKKNVCSGESITIATGFDNVGTGNLSGNFDIIETSNVIGNIEANESFLMPINTGCEPITYTFTATVTCSDNEQTPIFGSNLTLTIVVYPEYNADLITITDGSCGQAGEVNTGCANYILTPPASPTAPAPGESGNDTWQIDYNGMPPTGTCFGTIEVDVPYGCNPDCPAEPTISSNTQAVCSGGSAFLTGSFNAPSNSLSGSFTYTESSGVITNITEGDLFNLPTNDGCDPVLYTFTAQAICEDGSLIAGNVNDLTVTITVYPAFNADFLTNITGTCENAAQVVTNCDHYNLIPPTNPIIPLPGQNGADTWQVVYDSGDCIEPLLIEVPYSCNPDCPAEPVITSDTQAVCSGGSATITGNFNAPSTSLGGSFTITESSNTITTISSGKPFVLPANNSCDPVIYTFTAQATCEDGSLIAGNVSDLTVTITVYPTFNLDFLTSTPGSCEEAGVLTSTCANYTVNPQGTPTVPAPGESGTDLWTVNYNSGNCLDPLEIEVSYSCNPNCPAEPFISANEIVVCSGARATITGDFTTPSASLGGSFTITESTGTINNIVSGEPFVLPQNNACDPVIYTFTAQATCEDGSLIAGNIADLTVTITVYPDYNENLLIIEPGICGTAGALTSSCDNYLISPPANPTVPQPGDSGEDVWEVVYNDKSFANDCFDPVNVKVPYGCNPNCPSEPAINLDVQEVCSGGSVTITGVFGIPSNSLGGSFTLVESSGVISNIVDGTAFFLPTNNSCEPITYTFTAEARCEDGSLIPGSTNDLTATVVVYPDFNADLLTITNGACALAGSLASTCPNYIVASNGTPTIPAPGETGNDIWTVNYNAGPSSGVCFDEQTFEVPYSCNPNCPADPEISISTAYACGGNAVTISGIFNTTSAGLTGAFNITESSGSITNIAVDQPFTLPINNGCDPVTYTFTAEAVCEDGSLIAGSVTDLTATVVVYPNFNIDLVTVNEGTCDQAGSVTSSCAFYSIAVVDGPTIPNAGEVGEDVWVVNYDYQGNAPTGGACFEEISIEVPFNCLSTCPSEPVITTDVQTVCSGGTAKIDGFFRVQGSEGGTITITEAGGVISDITSGVPFDLPPNDGCDPVSYTFTAAATCSDGSNIPGNATDLTLQVIVYPAFNIDFINIENGSCGVPGNATTICDKYELNPSETPTSPEAGQSGFDEWEVTYNDPNAPNCFANATLEVFYNCGAACPSEPFISISDEEVCSGENITITGNFGQLGTGSLSGNFSISETSGSISNIQNGVSFDLPRINSCDPQTFTFIATASCDDNSPISAVNPEDMTVTVTVYPEFNPSFIEIEPGVCGTAGLANSNCVRYNIDAATLTVPAAGEAGEDIWQVNYDSDLTCFVNEEINVPFNCGVACPTSPLMEASEVAACSNGTVTISGRFGNQPTGSTGTFEIIETTGSIVNITNGIPFDLPENLGCEPIIYTFSATASCSGNPIVPDSPEDMLLTITVYPAFNENFVNITPGNCETGGLLNPICNNYIVQAPGNVIIPAPGESGTQLWTVSYDGNQGCFSNEVVEVPYGCDVLCPASPRISADQQSICSGGFIRLTGSFAQSSSVSGSFDITEVNGDITGIESGVVFQVPENRSCDVVTYTFTAVAICEDGSTIEGNNEDMTLTVNVFPEFNENFITIENGSCGTAGLVTSSCNNYDLTFVENTVPGQGESGTDTWFINYANSSCITNQIVQVPYNCGVSCPSEPSISPEKTIACGGEEVLILGSFGTSGGTLGGYFEITELSGKITNIENGLPFRLPENNSCDPIVYNFRAEAFCDDNTPILGTISELTTAITVYPAFNADFITITSGTCGEVGIATSFCDNYELTVSEQTLPESGESGQDNWTVTYKDDGNNFACFVKENISVPYNCGQSCPSSPRISASTLQVCSGGTVTIRGSFDQQGDIGGTFLISELSNTIGNIENGLAFELPENQDCEPKNYTFTATVLCADGSEITGSANNLTATITVYPAFNPDFVQITAGECGSVGSAQSFCSNYVLEAENGSTLAQPGEVGEDIWLVNYKASGGNNFACFTNEEVGVPYSCGLECPRNPKIEADKLSICSGEPARITGFVDNAGDNTLTAQFRITDVQGNLQDIQNGIPFDLPVNTTCDPVVHTFSATATCNGQLISGATEDLTLSITVYPAFNENLLSIENGECNKAGSASTTCSNYTIIPPASTTLPSEGDSGFDIWKVSYNDPNKQCFETIEVAVPYNCGVSCPSQPFISTATNNACGGELITIDGSFRDTGGGDLAGNFEIRETSDLIENIRVGQSFRLPNNNGCEPITYTFIASATCSDNTPINGLSDDLTLIITVYPEFNLNLVNVTAGNCSTTGMLTSICPNYSLSPPTSVTLPAEGEAGEDIWEVNFRSEDGASCFDTQKVPVPYSCALNCPSDPKLVVDQTEICSGATITLEGLFGTLGVDFLEGSFQITELSGALRDIEVGKEISMPANISCDPRKYTFQATALCANGEAIEGNSEDLQVIVTVYPAFNENLIAIQKGTCDRAGRAVPICDNYEVNIANEETVPKDGDAGFDQWLATYIGGGEAGACFTEATFAVPYSCGNNCPQDPRITARTVNINNYSGNVIEVCGGEAVAIRSSFNIEGAGTGGTISIKETSGTLTNIVSNQNFFMPENNTCDPINYTFTATAICDDDNEEIQGNVEKTTVTIIVYPSKINLDLLEIIDGNCSESGTITTNCDNYSFRAPFAPTIPVEGESGVDTWELNYTGKTPPYGSCIQRATIEVPFSCDPNCPVGPFLDIDQLSACSGESITINTAFSDPSAGGLATDFDIRLTSDNSSITAGEAFTLPINTTCEPIPITFKATVSCANGETIAPLQAGDLEVTVMVYPEPTSDLVMPAGGCDLRLLSQCGNEDLIIEYLQEDGSTWSTDLPIVLPNNNDEVSWRAYFANAPETCQTIGSIQANSCPEVGCPYPVIYAKRSTLNPTDQNNPISDNGPVILFCRLPTLINPSIDLANVSYEWGFYNTDRSEFIIPAKGTYNTSTWSFTPNTAIGNPGNTSESFYVVNPKDAVTDLRNYGVLVSTSDCSSNSVITWRGKTTDEDLIPLTKDFIKVYPNPNDGQFQLFFHHATARGAMSIELYNHLGQSIRLWKGDKQGNRWETALSLPNLDAGIYWLKVRIGDHEYVEKVVIY